MHNLLFLLLILSLPGLAYDGEQYPEQYEDTGEVYQDGSYPEESYPQETYPEPSYPQDTYQDSPPMDDMPAEEPVYQEQSDIVEREELRAMCQDYAAAMPPEEQAGYIEDCLRSHGF